MSAAERRTLRVQLRAPYGRWLDVGLLHHAQETSWFETLPEYWEEAPHLVLGQVFDQKGPGWRPSARVRLPHWFSHLLPEGRLRQAVAAAAKVNEEREFFLLGRIGGDDLPGAVRVLPADLDGRPIPPPVDDEQLESEDLGALRFSLAGVQLKFSVRADKRGLTIPARGQAGDWIAKLPDARLGYEGVPEAELAGLELARASGITVPEARLVNVASIAGLPEWAVAGGGRALVIRRFDRTESGGRVHVEELAQVLDVPTGHERFKYRRANVETIARFTAALCGPEAVGQVIERTVLNVLLGNGDAHVKNWAYCCPDGRTAKLSPAYDIVPTVLYVHDDDLGLKLAGSRRFEDVRVRSFERLAEKAGWDSALGRARAVEAVERVASAWHVLGSYLDHELVHRLTTRRDALPLLRT